MKLDRKHAEDTFASYVANYNAKDEKVKLKIDHTYRVAQLCERIATEIGLSKEDVDIAWFSGLLHDVGRFEQLRLYGTFNDAISVDHAQAGADLLFVEGIIKDYTDDSSQNELLERTIRCHNAYEIPDGLNERVKIFAKILRDADKIDILKVNVEVPLEEIYNVTTEELKNAIVSDAVMEAFHKHQTVLRNNKTSAIDYVVGHISLTYGLYYPCSVRIMKEQGYLDQIMQFQSANEKTQKQFVDIRETMNHYLEEKKSAM